MEKTLANCRKNLADLQRSLVDTDDIALRVSAEELAYFLDENLPRFEKFISDGKSIRITEYAKTITKELNEQYQWVILNGEFVEEMLNGLQDQFDFQGTDKAESMQGSVEDRVMPASVVEVLQVPEHPNAILGMAETSETRSRIHVAANARGQSNFVARRAQVQSTQLSSAASYKATFATLGAISFFGASVSWSSVFSGGRGDLLLLGWSSAVFAAATVAAGGMGIIVDSEAINFERNMQARRALRAFAITSATFVLVGIILLSATIVGIPPTYNDFPEPPLTRKRELSMKAAGWFSIVIPVIEVALALTCRVLFSPGRYKF
ncbi:hypothetical protein BDZ97DRAFT_433397 [Flammula alnicola]|nr:hypothetical protein BDZ97DRAFT_433397 [Flammula alnicola]